MEKAKKMRSPTVSQAGLATIVSFMFKPMALMCNQGI
jgi:hypothetical protein